MYAVVKEGGKQYKIKEGENFSVEKIDENIGKDIEIKEVLMLKNDNNITVGTPTIAGASVLCKIIAQTKEKKIIIFKHKRRKNYRKKQGHRQKTTCLKVISIKNGEENSQQEKNNVT